MIKNIKIKKRLLALTLGVSLGIGSFKLYENNEVNRVKGYLNDFVTEDNYVNLTRVSKDYNINSFKGKYLRKALNELDIEYVIIDDWIIFDGNKIGLFNIVDYTNGELLGYDNNGNAVYNGMNAIVDNKDGKLEYIVPDGYELRETKIDAGNHGPMKFETLDNYNIIMTDENNCHTFHLSKHK